MTNKALNAQVTRLRAVISKKLSIDIPVPVAQEAVAAVHGHKNWNTCVASWQGAGSLAQSAPAEVATGVASPAAESAGLCLGYSPDTGAPFILPDDHLARHCSFTRMDSLGLNLLAQQTRRGGGWLFVGMSRNTDELDSLRDVAKAAGRERDFYELNLADSRARHTWNPVLAGDPETIAAKLLDLLPSVPSSAGADYYRQQMSTVLVAIIRAAGAPFTLRTLTALLQDESALAQLESGAPPGAKSHEALRTVLSGYMKKDNKGARIDMPKLQEVLGPLIMSVALLLSAGSGKLGDMLNASAPDIILADVIQNHKMLYVSLPLLGKSDLALRVGRLFMRDLLVAIAHRARIPQATRGLPFVCLLDEPATYLPPGAAQFYGQARAANVAIISMHQSPSFSQLRPELPAILASHWTQCQAAPQDPGAGRGRTEICIATVGGQTHRLGNQPVPTLAPGAKIS